MKHFSVFSFSSIRVTSFLFRHNEHLECPLYGVYGCRTSGVRFLIILDKSTEGYADRKISNRAMFAKDELLFESMVWANLDRNFLLSEYPTIVGKQLAE